MTIDFMVMLPLTWSLFFVPTQMEQSSKCWVRSMMTHKGEDVRRHCSFEGNQVFANLLFSQCSWSDTLAVPMGWVIICGL